MKTLLDRRTFVAAAGTLPLMAATALADSHATAEDAAEGTAEDAAATATDGAEAMAEETMESVTHEVMMYTKDPDNSRNRNAFVPRLIKIKPGDKVNFISAQKTHNCQSTEGMLPEGAESWEGGISQDIEVTFDTPGVYGYHCQPHRTLGMVGCVVVEGEGVADNVEEAKKVRHSGRARRAWSEIWEQIEEEGMLA